jgi:anti-anti-sigma factor
VAQAPDNTEPGGFDVSVGELSGAMLVAPRGELDIAGTARFDEAVDKALSNGRDVVIDLRELSFIDSSGLRSLLRAARAASEGGTRLKILRGTGPVERALAITGVEGELPLVDA